MVGALSSVYFLQLAAPHPVHGIPLPNLLCYSHGLLPVALLLAAQISPSRPPSPPSLCYPPLAAAVTVKMDDIPFGAGAMRECYAMKKLSSHTTHRDWKRALNLVAKRYMNANASRQVCASLLAAAPPSLIPPSAHNPLNRSVSPWPAFSIFRPRRRVPKHLRPLLRDTVCWCGTWTRSSGIVFREHN